MDKEREIEKLARKICKSSSVGCNFPTCTKCGIKETCKARLYATRVINEGCGDTKQAVREFAEKLKQVLFAKCTIIRRIDDPIEEDMNSEEVNKTIDELLAEVIGE